MKIAIVGSRKYPFRHNVHYLIEMLKSTDIVVSGHSPGGGVDIWAEELATEHGLQRDIYPVPPGPREDFRKRAMDRNWKIARACDALIAFWDGDSTGTTHAFTAATSLGKPTCVIRPGDEDLEVKMRAFLMLAYNRTGEENGNQSN